MHIGDRYAGAPRCRNAGALLPEQARRGEKRSKAGRRGRKPSRPCPKRGKAGIISSIDQDGGWGLVTLLARWCIKQYRDTDNPAVRLAYGVLCGAVGIGLNLLLFVGKFIAGSIAGSIAITADAFNNLSDAGS